MTRMSKLRWFIKSLPDLQIRCSVIMSAFCARESSSFKWSSPWSGEDGNDFHMVSQIANKCLACRGMLQNWASHTETSPGRVRERERERERETERDREREREREEVVWPLCRLDPRDWPGLAGHMLCSSITCTGSWAEAHQSSHGLTGSSPTQQVRHEKPGPDTKWPGGVWDTPESPLYEAAIYRYLLEGPGRWDANSESLRCRLSIIHSDR